jgi:hypothetical protein
MTRSLRQSKSHRKDAVENALHSAVCDLIEKGIRDRHALERPSVDRYTRPVAQYQHQSLQARRSSTGHSNFLIAKSFEFSIYLSLFGNSCGRTSALPSRAIDVTIPEGGLRLGAASIPACSRAPSLLGFFINRQQQQGGGRGESGRVTPSTAYAARPSSSRLPTQIPEAPYL